MSLAAQAFQSSDQLLTASVDLASRPNSNLHLADAAYLAGHPDMCSQNVAGNLSRPEKMGHGDSWSNSIFDLSPSLVRVIQDLNPLLGTLHARKMHIKLSCAYTSKVKFTKCRE
ncbi:GPI transamidase component PIG-T isoform X1 [Canna indica]|uniref:GPI transamidase component PIG-T isoform X1 n=1 Tax=Canna indica TaxID=4628 RepID=A0AAQ3QJU4_9LILI|nr:GPI transamidase component PIG-T isoform X1 [Canna indica]